ncbi:hypothetical protein U1Q18_028733 [Sarracenia purpurea var. burkii]
MVFDRFGVRSIRFGVRRWSSSPVELVFEDGRLPQSISNTFPFDSICRFGRQLPGDDGKQGSGKEMGFSGERRADHDGGAKWKNAQWRGRTAVASGAQRWPD